MPTTLLCKTFFSATAIFPGRECRSYITRNTGRQLLPPRYFTVLISDFPFPDLPLPGIQCLPAYTSQYSPPAFTPDSHSRTFTLCMHPGPRIPFRGIHPLTHPPHIHPLLVPRTFIPCTHSLFAHTPLRTPQPAFCGALFTGRRRWVRRK